MISAKITSKIDDLHDLLEEIKYELDCITFDFDDLGDHQQRRVPGMLLSIENHLRRTAKRFSHIHRNIVPEWAQPAEPEDRWKEGQWSLTYKEETDGN